MPFIFKKNPNTHNIGKISNIWRARGVGQAATWFYIRGSLEKSNWDSPILHGWADVPKSQFDGLMMWHKMARWCGLGRGRWFGDFFMHCSILNFFFP